jgi:hypothetical protein
MKSQTTNVKISTINAMTTDEMRQTGVDAAKSLVIQTIMLVCGDEIKS